jgi:multidrug efflux pump
VAAAVAKVPGVIDISDGLPPPGIDWALEVDRAKAAQYGISPMSVGTVVQLVTTGLKLTDYRPAGADDAVDIRLRLPEDRRTLSALDELRIETAQGRCRSPTSSPARRSRQSAFSTASTASAPITMQGNVASATRWRRAGRGEPRLSARHGPARHRLEAGRLERGQRRGRRVPDERLRRGDVPDLHRAAGAVQQVHQRVGLVLSCVVMATIGALLGMMLTGQAFVIVMSGIGVIALAGVVVNNNIVLIDTYDRLREEGWNKLTPCCRPAASAPARWC